ncbi:hypothetical protein BJ508DRAFT_346131 [Ascobolus immersus RN42]|uniref:DNA topoisomerase I n=1 Tax=Ascobolus immersus RN42 TaxID=1160509 RepID=A0A3N4I5G6_ASCIM|nr:hypothetical protein BJ508DRAFT_346131 [Ascobolus immersus RN42]
MPSTGRGKGPAMISKALEQKVDREVPDGDEDQAADGIAVLDDVDMVDAVAPRGQRRARKPAVKEDTTDESDDDVPLTKRRKTVNGTPKKAVKESDSEDDIPLTKRRTSAVKKEVVTQHSDSDSDVPLTKKRAATNKRPLVKDESDDSDVPIAASAARKSLAKEKKDIEKAADVTAKKIRAAEKKKPAAKRVKKEESEDEVKPKAKPKAKANGTANGTKKGAKGKAVKDESPQEEEEEDEEYKWWLEQNNDNSVKWTTLSHNGVLFPPEYEPLPKHVKLYYDGKPVTLHPKAEEVAGFFGSMLNSEVNVGNPIFCANFFDDFQTVLKETGGAKDADGKKVNIKDFKKLDFTKIFEYYEADREAKRSRSAAEKKAAKAEKDAAEEKYLTCKLDGRTEKVGNFRVEPPGLFRGRGQHPKTGRVKQRVMPEQVTINIGKGEKVPSPPPGHNWAKVIHDNTVTWLATWKENINGNTKYVMLAATSSLKGMSDFKKFEKARELKKHIDRIRKDYQKDLVSKVMVDRQRATAMYFIDKLALRAGNEKGEDEADTVGCCSLRLEHITLSTTEEPFHVTFDFLGKDSIRYHDTVEVTEQVYKNLKIFEKRKSPEDQLFDRLNTPTLNAHLRSYMPGLTAKVFRTYNASWTMAQEIKLLEADKKNPLKKANVHEKILAYNEANRKVAILCNHQRTVGKAHDTQMEKLEYKVKEKKYKQYRIKHMMLKINPKLEKDKSFMADLNNLYKNVLTEKWIEQHHKDLVEGEKVKIQKKFEKENEKLEADGEKPLKDSELEDRLTAADDLEKQLAKEFKDPKKNIAVENANSTIEKCENNIAKLDESIQAIETQMIDKEANKTIALGTSKLNYIDPRITVMFCKKFELPIEKVFSKTLRDKFKWAIDSTDENWDF